MTARPLFGIVVFPGSNCDHDCFYVLKKVLHFDAVFIWHQEQELKGIDCVILPGGFSYGDYLRCGAIARFSPVMSAIQKFILDDGPVIGICNGFQILLEAGILPGAMLRNRDLKFICRDVFLKVEDNTTPFTILYEKGEVIKLPIAHAEGCYYNPDIRIDAVFRYCGPDGELSEEFNPNGSFGNIAGIRNHRGNVIGMMPHPERACEAILGGEDGMRIFLSVERWLKEKPKKISR